MNKCSFLIVDVLTFILSVKLLVSSRQQRRRLLCARIARRPTGAQVQPGLGRGHRGERAAQPQRQHSHGDVRQVQKDGVAEGGWIIDDRKLRPPIDFSEELPGRWKWTSLYAAIPEIFSDFFWALFILVTWLLILKNESRDPVVGNSNDKNHHRPLLDAAAAFYLAQVLKIRAKKRRTTNPILSSFLHPGFARALPTCWQMKARSSSKRNLLLIKKKKEKVSWKRFK